MASIFYRDDILYCIDYSIIDGEIYEFEKEVNGEFISIIEDEKTLIEISKKIIEDCNKDNSGYPAFIYNLVKKHKIDSTFLIK